MDEVTEVDQGEQRPVITYDLPSAEQAPSVLDEEREKHRRRAAKFGSDFVEPSKVRRGDRALVLEGRKERLARPGFATGIDVFATEEVEKRASRAARFGAAQEQSIQYGPDEEELAKARRAKKFGVDYTGCDGAMMEMDLFEERAEVSKDAERRTDAIYLYGVDVMSTGDCLGYFGDYGPTFVEWINDSSCVVSFRDRFSAARAMAGVGRPLPAEEMSGESSTGLDPTDPSNMPYFWHKGRDFSKQGTSIHLIYRMACETDRKDPKAPRKTRELWKGPPRADNRANKSRRTQGDQSAGHVRTDADGDVDMDAAGAGEEEGGGRGCRSRRRKNRNADGTVSTLMDVEQPEGEQGGEGAAGAGARAAGIDWEALEREKGVVEEEGGQQGVTEAGEMNPYEGRMEARGEQGGGRPSLLRRMIKAKRSEARGGELENHPFPSAEQADPAALVVDDVVVGQTLGLTGMMGQSLLAPS